MIRLVNAQEILFRDASTTAGQATSGIGIWIQSDVHNVRFTGGRFRGNTREAAM
jgi:hypothetical protein